MHRQRVRGGEHPLRCDQRTVAFAGHVHEGGKFGGGNAVPRIVHVVADDDGMGGRGRDREQGKKQESFHV